MKGRWLATPDRPGDILRFMGAAGPAEERLVFGDVTISTCRLVLSALRAEDADEMARVLGDDQLREFIGGHPASRDELRDLYGRWAAGCPDPDQVWLNWILRRCRSSPPMGTVQATLTRRGNAWAASIAWVVGVPWQNQGHASEAATGLVGWLQSHGVLDITASIHPDHRASAKVAARAGLSLTGEQIDGEQVWRSACSR